MTAALVGGATVLAVIVYLAALRSGDRRDEQKARAADYGRDLRLGARLLGVTGERVVHPLERQYRNNLLRDTFPAPREDDCAYGCCKAGDVGIGSEVARTFIHGRFPLDPNAPNPPGDPEFVRKMAQPVPFPADPHSKTTNA